MKALFQWVFLSLILVATNSTADSTKNAFKNISEKDLKKSYNYLAIAPLEAPAALKMPDAIRDMIETDITAQLQKNGFKILPAQTMRDIRIQMRELLGLRTEASEADNEKLATLLDHSYRELLLRHNIDGVVSLRVQAVGAPFENDNAKWYGTTQKIEHSGDGLMKFISGQKYNGTVAASSLKVSIWDRKESLLYSWDGGIEVLMQRKGNNLEYMPEDRFWQDEKRIKKAIKEALKPF